jgi:hypothetical protein
MPTPLPPKAHRFKKGHPGMGGRPRKTREQKLADKEQKLAERQVETVVRRFLTETALIEEIRG